MACLAIACSSSSASPPASSTADSGAQDDGAAKPFQGGDAAASDEDAAVATCESSFPANQTGRVQCCQQALPGGYSALVIAKSHCVCAAGGPCVVVCNYSECSQVSGQSEACRSCLETSLAGACASQIAAACASDPRCAAYEACVTK